MPSIFEVFPRLRHSRAFESISPPTPEYNCIAWSVQDSEHWWWPSDQAFWPETAPKEVTVAAFAAVYESLGYRECETGELESGVQKIALYAKDHIPTHAARQLANGRWTSKLGKQADIHHDVQDLEGEQYGRVGKYFCRQRPT